jgi:hypothetical protein
MRRIVPFILVIISLYGLVRLLRFVQQYDPALEQMDRLSGPRVSVELRDATIVSRAKGKTEWRLSADKIEVHSPEYGGLEQYSGVDLTGIRDGKLYRAGILEAGFSARSATYDQPAGQFTIDGPLKLTSVKGDKMEADTCLWSERTDEVRLSKGVRATVQGHRLTSPFVLFSPRKRVVNCPQGAEGVFDKLTMRASNLVWNIPKGRIECLGPVSGDARDGSWSAQNALLELEGDTESEKGRTHIRRYLANTVHMQLRIEGEELDMEARR